MVATTLDIEINEYISSLDQHISDAMYRLMQWNREIYDEGKEVKNSTRSCFYFAYLYRIIVSSYCWSAILATKPRYCG